MKRPALATLALSLLALLFGWETRQALLGTPGGQDNAATAGAWQPGVSAPDPQPPPDPAPGVSAVAARPLFRPDRQQFREQGVSVRNYEAELSRYTLLGVLGFGEAPFGVVVGKAGTKGERWEVKTGDLLQGFTVKEVGIEGLRLTADGKEFLLPLYAGAPTAATAATARVVAPPGPGAPGAVPGRAEPPPSIAPGPPQRSAPSAPRILPGMAQRYIPGRR